MEQETIKNKEEIEKLIEKGLYIDAMSRFKNFAVKVVKEYELGKITPKELCDYISPYYSLFIPLLIDKHFGFREMGFFYRSS